MANTNTPSTKIRGIELECLLSENILTKPNISSKEICDKFYITTNTFFRWLKWYNEGGFGKN